MTAKNKEVQRNLNYSVPINSVVQNKRRRNRNNHLVAASLDVSARGEVWGDRIYVKHNQTGMNSTYSSMLGKSVQESTNIEIKTSNTQRSDNDDLTLPNVFNNSQI